MKEYKTLQAFLAPETQEEMRSKLINLIRKNPTPIRALSKKIDINPVSLKHFLDGEDVGVVFLSRIEDFLTK